MKLRWGASVAVAALALGSSTAMGQAAAAQPAAARNAAWTVSTTSASKQSAYLAISAAGARNAWTVGYGPLVSRWDGARWSTMPTPEFPGRDQGVLLNQVVSVSASDTWVAGSREIGSRDFQAVFAHWFRGRWYTHALGKNFLIQHVSVFARNNVWLLGGTYSSFSTVTHAVSWHWNGVRWTRSALPAVPSDGSNDPRWVGARDAHNHATVLHYVGGRWVADPSLGSALPKSWSDFTVVDVLERTPHDVYAAVGPANSSARGAALYHWNGRTWTSVLSLPKGGPGPLTNDGHGGVWMFSDPTGEGQDPSARVVDIRGGRVVASVPQPRFSTGRFSVSDLTLRPGSRVLWASGATSNASNTVTHATVAAYRP